MISGLISWLIPSLLGGAITAAITLLWQRKARSRVEGVLEATASERDGLINQVQSLTAQLASSEAYSREQVGRLEERERALREKLADQDASKQALRVEFENLSREFLNARDKELRAHNQESLGAILKPLAEKIESFQTRVNQVHSEWLTNSSTLGEQIRQLQVTGLKIGTDAENLTKALKGDKKLVGNWGEAQLERTLELAGLQRGEHFEAQATFKDDSGQRFIPDFVIKLPDDKHVVIDSKVSLVDYEAAIAADNDADRDAALARHSAAVKAHIDSLASKDYAQLPGLQSPDFVLMFMPVEPAYIEVMKFHRELFSYGYQKGVVMVSHTTLMPILRTVSNLWMVERSNAEAREVSERAGDIFNSVCLVASRLQSLGDSLQTSTKKYNDVITAVSGRQGLHGKVERFQALSPKANKQFPTDLKALATDNDRQQLDGLISSASAEDAD